MSTAVYFQQDSLGVEEYSKHSASLTNLTNLASSNQLPLLARIMPLNQQHHQQDQSLHHQQQQYHHQQQHVPQQSHQVSDLAYGTLYLSYGQTLPETLSQNTPNGLYHLSVNTTPASSFPNSNYITSTMMSGQTLPLTMQTMGLAQSSGGYLQPSGLEKCTCKSNPNRIPRPRNAFILFRQKYHQSVLDESSEAKTNPEVSRELGRRWRALSPSERDHWNNLAEEEKQNHAKKYPNYRYTPRRNGKNKNCPVCHLKTKRQVSVAQNQTHYLAQQHDQAQILTQTAQKLPLSQQQMYPTQMQQYIPQQQVLGPQSPHQQLQQSSLPHQLQQQLLPHLQLHHIQQSHQHHHQQSQQQQQQQQQQLQQQLQLLLQVQHPQQLLAQPANTYLSQLMYMYPYQQVGQFGYGEQASLTAQSGQQNLSSQQSPLQLQSINQLVYQHQPLQQQQLYLGSEVQVKGQYGAYDLGHVIQPQQRFNSLPTPMANNSGGYEVFMPSQPQH